jgi:integrase
VSPRVKPTKLNETWRRAEHPSPAEFRSEAAKGEIPRAFSSDEAFWKYLLTPAVPSPLGVADYGLDRAEHRVLSKASSAAGGYLVPTSFDDQITSARWKASTVRGFQPRRRLPSSGTERPKVPAKRWRILEPVEIGRVLKAFTDEQARAIFLTVVLTGLRRFELKALRWRDVALVEGVLRVRVSKSEEGSA